MWSSKSWPHEDEEALLLLSSTTKGRHVLILNLSTLTTYAAKWRRVPRALLRLFCQLLIFGIPSFLHNVPTSVTLSEKRPHLAARPQTHSTDYLDGVRGLASLIVFVFHWTHMHFPNIFGGYHSDKHNSIWLLPGPRFLYSGPAMVCVFFVLSGFVLTRRFVQKMHAHDFDTLYSGLTSLTFRRAVRLFLPSLASCVLAYLCASLGIIPIPAHDEDGHVFRHGPHQFLRYIDLETNPYTWESYMGGYYNRQLWSIVTEFRGSLVTFLMVLGLARTRMSIRVLVEMAITVHAFVHQRWDVALFITGMLLAELDVFVHMSRSRTAIMQERQMKVVFWFMICAGMYLAGFPREDAVNSYGYGFANHRWPSGWYKRRFWLSIASILLVTPLPFLPNLQSFFCTRLMRYLGKISFALYLVHGLGNKTVGSWLMKLVWMVVGKHGYKTYISSYVICTMLYVPIIIWWSDMYWRAFDIPATKFAKWLEVKSQSSRSGHTD